MQKKIKIADAHSLNLIEEVAKVAIIIGIIIIIIIDIVLIYQTVRHSLCRLDTKTPTLINNLLDSHNSQLLHPISTILVPY